MSHAAPATPTAPAAATIISVAGLERFIRDALLRLGVRAGDAATTARALATTDSWGTFTHGVKCLSGYVARLRDGGLDATATPSVIAEGLAWAQMDGHSAIAMVTSVAAMQCAIVKARACGIAYVGVRNSCHFGAAGYYASLAAEQGMIGLAMANDHPSMTVPGAKGRVLGNNPFAFAIPYDGTVVMLDMALSTVAGGKIMAAHFLGKAIPVGWSVDSEGEPTTDPASFLNGGALTPMAGHKGYGLGILVEALSAVMTGARITSQVGAWLHDRKNPTGHGAAFIALDIAAMMPKAEFDQRMRGLVDEIHRAPRTLGCDRIYLPGEIEMEKRAIALRDGIVLPGDVAASLRTLASDLTIDLGPYLS